MRIIALLLIFFNIGLTFSTDPKTQAQLLDNASIKAAIPGKLVVKLKKNIDLSALKNKLSTVGGTNRLAVSGESYKPVMPNALKTSVLNNIYYLSFDFSISLESEISRVWQTGLVEYVEPIYPAQSLAEKPNDPDLSKQYQLDKIKAYEAWAISKGSSDVVIAIIDSGVDYDHPDLKDNLFVNTGEIEGDGIDNDGDGYVDNYLGWDFCGANIDLLFDASSEDWIKFQDGDPSSRLSRAHHGTHVAGISSAMSNNGEGGAGSAPGCKYMALKCTDDILEDPNDPKGLYFTTEAIKYAADHGAHIINASYGSDFYSQYTQDIIEYATVEKGCLIVAAAGNHGTTKKSYPAAYKYVLSVANTNAEDIKHSSSTYDYTVDISAPGAQIYSTIVGGGYNDEFTGTSMSSPLVAGAAAVVKSVFPEYTGMQVGEQLRVTADPIQAINKRGFINKLGSGRLNLFRALTERKPSLRVSGSLISNANGQVVTNGDQIYIYLDITNYLQGATNVTVTVEDVSSYVSPISNQATLSAIGTMEEQKIGPFVFDLSADATKDLNVPFTISYASEGYEDKQVIEFQFNETYRNIIQPELATTVTSNGRVGFVQPGAASLKGLGFVYNGENLLFEMGLISGNSSGKTVSSIRTGEGEYAKEFQSVKDVSIALEPKSEFDLVGSFNDSVDAAKSLGLQFDYRTLSWSGGIDKKYVILEYIVKNTTDKDIANYHLGVYADWDLMDTDDEASSNYVAYDANNKLGYVTRSDIDHSYAGFMLVNVPEDKVNYRSLETNLDVEKDYSDQGKFSSISSGLKEATIGSKGQGVDVAMFAGAGPYDIKAGDSIVIAFAALAADNLTELTNAAVSARQKYNVVLQIAKPEVDPVTICQGEQATLTVKSEGDFLWYKSLDDVESFFTGKTYQTDKINKTTTFYVAKKDGDFESNKTAVIVNVGPDPSIKIEGAVSFCNGNGKVVLTAAQADSYEWSSGETTQSITIESAGSYWSKVSQNGCVSITDTITISSVNTPTVEGIVVSNDNICVGSNVELSVTNPINGAEYLWIGPNGFVQRTEAVTITDFEPINEGTYSVSMSLNGCVSDTKSVDLGLSNKFAISQSSVGDEMTISKTGSSYQWYINNVMIDGATSKTYKPVVVGAYHVVVKDGNCAVVSETFTPSVLVGVTDKVNTSDNIFSIYPNPTSGLVSVDLKGGELVKDISFKIYDIQGQLVAHQTPLPTSSHSIEFPKKEGMYILMISLNNKVYFEKVLVK